MVIFFNKLATENKANEEQLSPSTHSCFFPLLMGCFYFQKKRFRQLTIFSSRETFSLFTYSSIFSSFWAWFSRLWCYFLPPILVFSNIALIGLRGRHNNLFIAVTFSSLSQTSASFWFPSGSSKAALIGLRGALRLFTRYWLAHGLPTSFAWDKMFILTHTWAGARVCTHITTTKHTHFLWCAPFLLLPGFLPLSLSFKHEA